MVINIEKIDNKHKNLYSIFSKICIEKLGLKSNIIDIKSLTLGQILISPYLFFKSKNINDAFNFSDFDMIVFGEGPTIDVLSAFKKDDKEHPFYDTRLIGFNNQKLLNEYKDLKLTDEQLYEHCKKNNYKVKCLFGNILIEDKMKMFGVQYIKEEIRDKGEKDIINYLKNHD
jgi:hypothetical protein